MTPESPPTSRDLGLYGPRPTPLSSGFWAALREGRVDIQRCQQCRRWQHPPQEVCGRCGGEMGYETVEGTGHVYSRTTTERIKLPFTSGSYTVAVIELDEQERLRMVARLEGSAEVSPEIGDRVRLIAGPLLGGPDAVPLYRALTPGGGESGAL